MMNEQEKRESLKSELAALRQRVQELEQERDKAEIERDEYFTHLGSAIMERDEARAQQQEREVNPISRRDFLKLPMSERRRLLREQAELLRALSRDSDAMEEKGMME